MTAKIGLDVVTYLAGTIGTPIFTNPIGIIKDESVDIEKAVADITDRRAKGWRLKKGTLKEGSITMTITNDPADADYLLLEAAFFNDTQVILFFADGDATEPGTYKGLLAACNVLSFSGKRNLEDAVVNDLKLSLDLEDTTDEAPRMHSVVVV